MTVRALAAGVPVRVTGGLAKGKSGVIRERVRWDWEPDEPLWAVDLTDFGLRVIRATYLEPTEVAS